MPEGQTETHYTATVTQNTDGLFDESTVSVTVPVKQ
jgi:hypothetical protein